MEIPEGYKLLDRKKYKEIVEEAKGNKITYKNIGKDTYYKIEFPKLEITFLTVSEKQESVYKPAEYVYKQFDNLTSKCSSYQYCDNCSENTPHYKRGGYLCCRVCYIGYAM